MERGREGRDGEGLRGGGGEGLRGGIERGGEGRGGERREPQAMTKVYNCCHSKLHYKASCTVIPPRWVWSVVPHPLTLVSQLCNPGLFGGEVLIKVKQVQ